MKAEINGIKLEGTPQEIADVIKLVGDVKQTVTYIKFVPRPETPSPYPYPQYPVWATSIGTAAYPTGVMTFNVTA